MIICPSLLYFPIFEKWWYIAENYEQNVTTIKNSIFTIFWCLCFYCRSFKILASINIDEVIRSVLNFLFFCDKISQVQKSIKKEYKALKAQPI